MSNGFKASVNRHRSSTNWFFNAFFDLAEKPKLSKVFCFSQYLRKAYSGKKFSVAKSSSPYREYGSLAFRSSLRVENVSEFVLNCCKSSLKKYN